MLTNDDMENLLMTIKAGRIMGATVGMYGDLQGITGKSILEIEEF